MLRCAQQSLKTVIATAVAQNRQKAMSTASSRLDLEGIYPPIPTPFDDKEEIDYPALQRNIEKWSKIPFRGLTVHGSNGEYTFLTTDERIDMVKKVRSWLPKDKLIIAGAGCESTRCTIKMSERMAKVGADAVLVITPSYYKGGMTSEALTNHFVKVADASPVPVILYNVPKFTTIELTVEAILALAKHKNIIALKESSGNVAKIGHIVHWTKGEDFTVLAGSADHILQSHVIGASGGICALANVLGEEVCRLYELCRTGDITAATLLQQKLIGPNAAVTSKFGVPGLKFAMEQFGYYGGDPRSPLLPLAKEKQSLLLSLFQEDQFLK
ncbi:putative 4-hydroxy-2-oxoglutarate aldolase, mitochondrial isoform X1 [Apostichopus japonicus]|uniref:4-hydroxy-2-oxoglutarate aldolase, mitochondrial n=1 Tax=Stichopus japonicus TaxID=307972 RepID=A0A2G8LNT7_STIJA|nr:putative 4-hydroxy-2-oxoglutarate aldolase, mitochondrial isoform X1 [Apostichopus japonicus]